MSFAFFFENSNQSIFNSSLAVPLLPSPLESRQSILSSESHRSIETLESARQLSDRHIMIPASKVGMQQSNNIRPCRPCELTSIRWIPTGLDNDICRCHCHYSLSRQVSLSQSLHRPFTQRKAEADIHDIEISKSGNLHSRHWKTNKQDLKKSSKHD